MLNELKLVVILLAINLLFMLKNKAQALQKRLKPTITKNEIKTSQATNEQSHVTPCIHCEQPTLFYHPTLDVRTHTINTCNQCNTQMEVAIALLLNHKAPTNEHTN